MKKRTPDHKPASNGAEILTSASLERASRLFDRVLDHVERSMDDDEMATSMIRELANLTRAIVTLESERRKERLAELKRLQKITPEMCLAAMRQFKESERANILREAARMDNGDSVLA